MTEKFSYGQILKSSSIMGGAAGITLILDMIRTKFAAVLIGTTGVGLLAGFGAVQGFIGVIAGLGIQSSAVRDLAAAVGQGDQQAIGRAVLTLRRLCWLTGLAGMLMMIAFSPLLSQLTFNSKAYTLDIAALGVIILLNNIAGGQLVLLQGMRRINDMARANIAGALVASTSAVGFYHWLGLRGIIPSLICIAVLRMSIAWFYGRRVPVPPVSLTWRQTCSEANGMVKLGLVFMCVGLLSSAVSYLTITLITRQIDLHAVGIYSAAFALSGVFVNFVLGAMSADYYPRLTAAASDKAAVNRLVNEQTEIGILLAVPGLMVTLALAPWVLEAFYSTDFLGAVELMQWFVLGCLGRVITWPLGFVILALGKSRWFLLTETTANLVHLFLIVAGLRLFGLEGVAMAFFVLYVGYFVGMYLVCQRLTKFSWSRACFRIFWLTLPIMFITFICCRALPAGLGSLLGLALSAVASVICLREVASRIGTEHRIVRAIAALPGTRFLLPTIKTE